MLLGVGHFLPVRYFRSLSVAGVRPLRGGCPCFPFAYTHWSVRSLVCHITPPCSIDFLLTPEDDSRPPPAPQLRMVRRARRSRGGMSEPSRYGREPVHQRQLARFILVEFESRQQKHQFIIFRRLRPLNLSRQETTRTIYMKINVEVDDSGRGKYLGETLATTDWSSRMAGG